MKRWQWFSLENFKSSFITQSNQISKKFTSKALKILPFKPSNKLNQQNYNPLMKNYKC